MRHFADLLDRLIYSPQRSSKLRLLEDYFRSTPDPDRGYALAVLTSGLDVHLPVRRTLAELMAARVDPELYRLSRDYVGDTAETVALLWPSQNRAHDALRLSEVAETLLSIERNALAPKLAGWLDRLDTNARFALLKMLTGGLRAGVSARIAKAAIAELGAVTIDEVEEVWHGIDPPYPSLFRWLEGKGPRPDNKGLPVFRPPMLAHPLEEGELDVLDAQTLAAEWKWDGIRVQIASGRGVTKVYSRTGDDIGRSFPDLIANLRFDGVLDGELLVMREGVVAPFNDLQQRLNRKTVSAKLMRDFPVHVRLYDALFLDGDDLRPLAFDLRRRRLETWFAAALPARCDLSDLLSFESADTLRDIWQTTREIGIEGIMLKRRDSPYLAGRPKGHWWKWKRTALTADCVLLYAQRGSGKRSSYYSDFTFGAWRLSADGRRELVPVGKAYSGFTDAELLDLDRFVRNHTVERFGPVRAVEPKLVLEVAFDAVQGSARHKSGIALRFPRIHRIRWDKPAEEAEDVARLASLIPTRSDP
jgi:DNA ligase-1